MTKEENTQYSADQINSGATPSAEEQLQDKTADFFSRSNRRQQAKNTGNNPRNQQQSATSVPIPSRYTLPAVTIGLNIVWWQQPLIYHQAWQNAQNWHIWSLIAYSLLTALALAFQVQNRFSKTDRRAWLALAASLIVVVNSQLRSRFEILFLLLLFIAFLLILPIRSLQLQNALGLIGLSVLLTFTVPICITYLANNYVSPEFLQQSWLLVFASLFYFTPLFLPSVKGRRLELLTAPLFLIFLFWSQGFGILAGLAALFAIAAFLLTFIRPLTYQYQPIMAVLGLVVTTMLFYH